MERNIFNILNEKNNISYNSERAFGGWYKFLVGKNIEKLLKSIKSNKINTNNYLCQLKEYFGITYSEIVKKSNFKESYIKESFNGRRPPSREAIIGLCFAFGLNFNESNMLLKSAGYNEFYPRNERDLIISKSLIDNLSVQECNKLLLSYKFDKIGNYDENEG